jgi:hypothetical protein
MINDERFPQKHDAQCLLDFLMAPMYTVNCNESFSVFIHLLLSRMTIEFSHDMKMRIANIFSRYMDLKEANIPTLTNQHSYKVSQFHKMLKNVYGQSLAKLQVSSI